MILVTGSNGFLGSCVVRHAKARGLRVRGIGIGAMSADGELDYRSVDISDFDALSSAMQGCEIVIHAAGVAHGSAADPGYVRKLWHVNDYCSGLVARAAAAAGARELVMLSSVSVYGSGGGPPFDESKICAPTSEYARSKLAGETRVCAEAAASALGVSILRLATAFGEGDRGNVRRLIKALHSRRFLWIGTGENRKTLVYKDDVASACLDASAATRAGVKIYNIGDVPVTLASIVSTICRALGRQLPRARVPSSVVAVLQSLLRCAPLSRGQEFAGLIDKWLCEDVYANGRAKAELGFCPAVSTLDGLYRAAQWFLSEIECEVSPPKTGSRGHSNSIPARSGHRSNGGPR